MISHAPFGLSNKTQPRLRLLIVRARSSSWRCISAKPRVPYAQLKPIRVMATCHAATPCNTINISSCRSLRISYEAPCPNVCVCEGSLDIITFRPYSTEWAGEPTERESAQCTASTRCQRSACFNCGCASGWSKPYSLSLSAKAVSNKSLCCFASPKIPCKARRLGYGDKALGVRKEIKIPIIRRSTDPLAYFQTVAILVTKNQHGPSQR